MSQMNFGLESPVGNPAPLSESEGTPLKNDIIPTELAIRAMRDSGYRNTAYALAELIDNSVQAGGDQVEVFCIEQMEMVNTRSRRRVKEIAVLDNGSGMKGDVLRVALQFGNGTHLKDRSGIGRFGMGLPNASISQGKRVDVWTWTSGPENALHSYLDIDEIETKRQKVVPEPEAKPVPAEWRSRSSAFGTTGTLVVWSKVDEGRLTWKGAKATLENTESLIGRIYRKFIDRGNLLIRLRALDVSGTSIFERDARANDPLYLMSRTSTDAPFDKKPMFQRYGEKDKTYDIKFGDALHKVIVRASWATEETKPTDGIDRGRTPYGKHAAKNIGVSIVRADRELELDDSWANSDPTERWWGIEVDFPPGLDEVFGVTNNKQAATLFSHLSSFDWKLEAEQGESYLDFKKRLEDVEDPRAKLFELVDYIKDTISRLRGLLEDQTKGLRSKAEKRHDDTSTEDRATTGFKQRAKEGHSAQGDNEEFDKKAQEKLVDDLVKNKKYSKDAAEEIMEAVKKRERKVIFVEIESEMDAFFGVEPPMGDGLTKIVFNRNHPAHKLLVHALNDDVSGCSEKELVGRIENAADTLEMLFAAWARVEIEDVPNRDKLKRMRQDWGRMANDFLQLATSPSNEDSQS